MDCVDALELVDEVLTDELVEKLEDVDPVSVGITVDVPLLEFIGDVVKGSEFVKTELVVLFGTEGASLEALVELLTTVD